MLLKFAKRVLRDKQRQVQDMLVQLVLMANIKKIHIHMSTIVQRVLRDKRPQMPLWGVCIVLLVNFKTIHHQLSTLVRRVLRDKRLQITIQVVQIVLRVNFKVQQQQNTVVNFVKKENLLLANKVNAWIVDVENTKDKIIFQMLRVPHVPLVNTLELVSACAKHAVLAGMPKVQLLLIAKIVATASFKK
jgi:hypothetical protein